MFARYCGPGYAAHWDQAVEAIIDCMSYPHPTLKQAITRAFHFQVENILKTLGNAEAAANLPEKIINVGRQVTKKQNSHLGPAKINNKNFLSYDFIFCLDCKHCGYFIFGYIGS